MTDGQTDRRVGRQAGPTYSLLKLRSELQATIPPLTCQVNVRSQGRSEKGLFLGIW